MENIANHVEGLKARYSSVEASGHSELNELRGMAASLERQWNKFSKEMKSHSTNLDLSLKFQETLFKVGITGCGSILLIAAFPFNASCDFICMLTLLSFPCQLCFHSDASCVFISMPTVFIPMPAVFSFPRQLCFHSHASCVFIPMPAVF